MPFITRHVEALNLIDVEFSEPSEEDVRDAWKTYLDHLTQMTQDTKEPDEAKRKSLQEHNEEPRKDLLAELLQKMGVQLGYNFDFTYLKNRAYYPVGHGTIVEEEGAVRKGLIEMLWKGRRLFVRAIEPSVQLPDHKQGTADPPRAVSGSQDSAAITGTL